MCNGTRLTVMGLHEEVIIVRKNNPTEYLAREAESFAISNPIPKVKSIGSLNLYCKQKMQTEKNPNNIEVLAGSGHKSNAIDNHIRESTQLQVEVSKILEPIYCGPKSEC